jgi:hypothetical protein
MVTLFKARPCGATSSILIRTTSQALSLLSMAKLNMALSRIRSSTCSLVRIDQTFLVRSGGFGPVSLPLFQGMRLGAGCNASSLGMVLSSGY